MKDTFSGDLLEELNNRSYQLDLSLKYLRKSGEELANAEKEYKIKLREKVLKMKDDGIPATLINLVIYGDDEVARLRFERDCKEAIYKANQEAINTNKLTMRILSDLYEREFDNEI